jgi:hypothetical protein
MCSILDLGYSEPVRVSKFPRKLCLLVCGTHSPKSSAARGSFFEDKDFAAFMFSYIWGEMGALDPQKLKWIFPVVLIVAKKRDCYTHNFLITFIKVPESISIYFTERGNWFCANPKTI